MTMLSAVGRPLDDLQLYTIPETMRRLRLGRTSIYEQIRAGRLRTVAQGRARRITAGAIAEYIALLEREAEQEVA